MLIQKHIPSNRLILWLMGPMNRNAFALVVLVDLYTTCQTMNCHVLLCPCEDTRQAVFVLQKLC